MPPLWETIHNPRNQQILSRRESWRQNPVLFEAILKVLFIHDPIGICDHDHGVTEYCAEVDTILPRLQKGMSVDGVYSVVLEELNRWFGDSGRRDPVKYKIIAEQIWEQIHQE